MSSPAPDDTGRADDVAAEIRRLSDEWMDAAARHDWPALDRLMGEDFVLVGKGGVTDRATWLRNLSRMAVESFAYGDVRVRALGDVALMHSLASQRATVDSRDWSGDSRLTDVWHRRHGRWVVVARQSTWITDAAAAPEAANKALVRRHFDQVANAGNLALADEIVAPDYVDHTAPVGPVTGPENIKRAVTRLRQAFAGFRATIQDIVAEGDRVVVRLRTEGVHAGEFAGVPPTGKRIAFEGIVIWRVAGGRLAERWAYFDTAAFRRQAHGESA